MVCMCARELACHRAAKPTYTDLKEEPLHVWLRTCKGVIPSRPSMWFTGCPSLRLELDPGCRSPRNAVGQTRPDQIHYRMMGWIEIRQCLHCISCCC